MLVYGTNRHALDDAARHARNSQLERWTLGRAWIALLGVSLLAWAFIGVLIAALVA